MAEIVSTLLKNLSQNLSANARPEICISCCVHSDRKKLNAAIGKLRTVLLDVEEKHEHEVELKLWLEQLKDVLYDADNLFDEMSCEALRNKVVFKHGAISEKVCRFFSCTDRAMSCLKMACRVKEIRKRLDVIVADSYNLGLIEKEGRIMGGYRRREMAYCLVNGANFIGRERDKSKVVKLLCRPSVSENVCVISIVGFRGMGKTTLAREVYNDRRIVREFQIRMWVRVSGNFNVQNLTKDLLNCVFNVGIECLAEDQLEIRLRERLDHKKFLLVLDDVSHEDVVDKWWELREILKVGSFGSKVVVTTHDSLVGKMTSTSRPYDLKGLSDEDSWALFEKYAFRGREEEDDQFPLLKSIGKEVLLKRCSGVPLAIKILGSVLYHKASLCEWERIRDSEIWETEEIEGGGILAVLRLSYNLMPSYLKPCLLYFSLFPKGHEFCSSDLIQSSMSQGIFVNFHNDNQELEDIGVQYFMELLSRSFFQDVVEHQNIYCFKIHDLIHDLALCIAKRECLILNSNSKNVPENIRQISFSSDYKQALPFLHKYLKGTALRSIICLRSLCQRREEEEDGATIKFFLHMCVLKFKYLRHLDLRFSSIEELPKCLGRLKHLRYLNLGFNRKIKKLPKSICKMHSLQTLILLDCFELEELPKKLRNLISLRFFVFTTKQRYLPKHGVGCLISLQTLGIYDCENLESICKDIKHLISLRKLVISGCKSLISLPIGMRCLTSLETLKIVRCEKLKSMGEEEDNQDNKTMRLRYLTLDCLPELETLPKWLDRSARTFQFIQIRECPNLKELTFGLGNFKSLEKLSLVYCPGLTSLPEGMDRLTSLRELHIVDCSELSRRCENGVGDDWCKISHVPKVCIV